MKKNVGIALMTLALASLLLPAQIPLPGTSPLTEQGDLAAQMVEGINQYLLRATAESVAKRPAAPDRERLKKIIGAIDPRVPGVSVTLKGTTSTAALVAKGHGYNVYAASWPVLEGITAEGLLFQPDRAPVARVVAIPDADWSPEMLAGLETGVEPTAQFARRLAENGCQLLVPVLINRADTWSGIPGIRMTNQPHREWIYRMSFEVGRHIIGYEVQKILAAVDWFKQENSTHTAPIGVTGYGEGGLLALYSAALDPRIQAVAVSGYF